MLVNYLRTYRLQWGQPDRLSLLPSMLDVAGGSHTVASLTTNPPKLPPKPVDAPPYFTADTPPEFISIIMNDWPYSGGAQTPLTFEIHHF